MASGKDGVTEAPSYALVKDAIEVVDALPSEYFDRHSPVTHVAPLKNRDPQPTGRPLTDGGTPNRHSMRQSNPPFTVFLVLRCCRGC